MISGFAATGGAEGSAVGVGVLAGDATGVAVSVAAGDGESLGLDGMNELVGAAITVAATDAWSEQAATTDVATATTRRRTIARWFMSFLAV